MVPEVGLEVGAENQAVPNLLQKQITGKGLTCLSSNDPLWWLYIHAVIPISPTTPHLWIGLTPTLRPLRASIDPCSLVDNTQTQRKSPLKLMHAPNFCANGLSSSAATDTTLRSALVEWKAARTLLANTIQSYLVACATLRAVCTTPTYQPSQRTLVEELLVTVDSELESLVSEENALYKMRMSLVTARNNLSATLVPVNTLPPEILARIFAMSNACCIRETKQHPNFTGVCVYWRQVATNAAHLWTHIDVGPGASESLANLLLQRAKDSPLHVHLHEPKSENDQPTPEHEVSRATSIIMPHVHRIRSLDVESYGYSRGFVGAMLNLWLEGGSPSLAKSLVVYRPNASMLLSPDGHSRNVTLMSRSENAMGIMQALNKLHLQNVILDMDSSTYRNLVDLQLSCFCAPTSISISQLADVLSANPALATLKLSSLTLTRPENWSHPMPIALSCVQVMNIFHLDADSLRLLLPLISLPAASVAVGIGPVPFSQIRDEFKGLLTRSNLTALYCWQDKGHTFPVWSSLLRLFPSLDNLVLDEFHMGDEPVIEESTSGSRPPPPPRLPSVLLLDCTITLVGLTALVAEYSIQSLRLERCKIFNGSEDGLEGTRASLSATYPELECTISGTPSTGQLEYCRIFDR
ncbi:hypothetical protein FRC10_004093 [Ceratobasidium sp. 414]|nr:hypothetical protein FRC10_004093 [Ceratobasidium sp. 414]